MRSEQEIKERAREEWLTKLGAAILKSKWGSSRVHAVAGPIVLDEPGLVSLDLDGFDLHELYTRLVDNTGPEGCCAGLSRLPVGWCRTCDAQRSA